MRASTAVLIAVTLLAAGCSPGSTLDGWANDTPEHEPGLSLFIGPVRVSRSETVA